MKVGRIGVIVFGFMLLMIGGLLFVSRPFASAGGASSVLAGLEGGHFEAWEIPRQSQPFTLNAHDQSNPNLYAIPSMDIQPKSWSPDGEWLVYHVQYNGDCGLYVARPNGADWRQITDDCYFDSYSSWSPDGRWIAYIITEKRGANLYKIRPDGTDAQLLVENVYPNTPPTWSPDSRWIVLELYQEGNWDIYSVRADGSNLRRLTLNRSVDAYSLWSPDGRWIVYVTQYEKQWNLYRILPDGSQQMLLASVQSRSQGAVTWSPDSQWLVYESEGDLYRVRHDGTSRQQLTFSTGRDFHPSWSPDGRWIAFLMTDHLGRRTLYQMHPDGTNLQEIGDYRLTSRPLWSPQRIASTRVGWQLMLGAVLIVGCLFKIKFDRIRNMFIHS